MDNIGRVISEGVIERLPEDVILEDYWYFGNSMVYLLPFLNEPDPEPYLYWQCEVQYKDKQFGIGPIRMGKTLLASEDTLDSLIDTLVNTIKEEIK